MAGSTLYPGAIDDSSTLYQPGPGDLMNSVDHAGLHDNVDVAVIATQTKLGTGSSTPVASTVLRGTGTGTSAWGQANLTTDVTGTLPVANGGTGVTSKTGTGNAVLSNSPTLSAPTMTSATLTGGTITTPTISNPTISSPSLTGYAAVLALIYPVGCIYTETTGTNPGTTFGFGTWAAYGAGEVLVGYKSGDANFGTAGGTGGEATHTLSSTEMPSHTHGIGWNNGGGYLPANSTNISSVNVYGTNDYSWSDRSQNGYVNLGLIQNTGGGGAHNNLQPYIVVYFWQRTA